MEANTKGYPSTQNVFDCDRSKKEYGIIYCQNCIGFFSNQNHAKHKRIIKHIPNGK